VSDGDILDLKIIVGSIITILLERLSEFNSQKDLLDWIENQKFS
jgi:hypothetical protein